MDDKPRGQHDEARDRPRPRTPRDPRNEHRPAANDEDVVGEKRSEVPSHARRVSRILTSFRFCHRSLAAGPGREPRGRV
jgi:hypothetical protein